MQCTIKRSELELKGEIRLLVDEIEDLVPYRIEQATVICVYNSSVFLLEKTPLLIGIHLTTSPSSPTIGGSVVFCPVWVGVFT